MDDDDLSAAVYRLQPPKHTATGDAPSSNNYRDVPRYFETVGNRIKTVCGMP